MRVGAVIEDLRDCLSRSPDDQRLIVDLTGSLSMCVGVLQWFD
jgi:hypothetical protein